VYRLLLGIDIDIDISKVITWDWISASHACEHVHVILVE
jgi:hypothetical protein